jgi:hypothetical protein
VVGRGDNSPAAVAVACHNPAVGRGDNSPAVVVAACHSPAAVRGDNSLAAAVADGQNLADHSSRNCRRRNARLEQLMCYRRMEPPQKAWQTRLRAASRQQPSSQYRPGPCGKKTFSASSKNPSDADHVYAVPVADSHDARSKPRAWCVLSSMRKILVLVLWLVSIFLCVNEFRYFHLNFKGVAQC